MVENYVVSFVGTDSVFIRMYCLGSRLNIIHSQIKENTKNKGSNFGTGKIFYCVASRTLFFCIVIYLDISVRLATKLNHELVMYLSFFCSILED